VAAVDAGAASCIAQAMLLHEHDLRLLNHSCSTLTNLHRHKKVDPEVLSAIVQAGAVEAVRHALHCHPLDSTLWDRAVKLFWILVDSTRVYQLLEEEGADDSKEAATDDALYYNQIVVARNIALCDRDGWMGRGLEITATDIWLKVDKELCEIDVRQWEPEYHGEEIWGGGSLRQQVVVLLLCHREEMGGILQYLSMDIVIALCRTLSDYMFRTHDNRRAIDGVQDARLGSPRRPLGSPRRPLSRVTSMSSTQ